MSRLGFPFWRGRFAAIVRMVSVVAVGGIGLAAAAAPAAQQRYDHGDPTAHEQLMLELINTARAAPAAEASRLGIGLNDGLAPGRLRPDPQPPVAFHPVLLRAARDHADWMLSTGKFTHTGSNGTSPTQRAATLGYGFGVAENISYRSTNTAVNLGPMTRANHQGLFRSPSHRTNLLNAANTVTGLGVRTGRFGGFNAAMVTQKFSEGGATVDSGPFLVGVAFRDRNGNGSYDPGEGVAGLEVRPASGPYYAVTSASGGYALPLVPLQTVEEVVPMPIAASAGWDAARPYDEDYRARRLAQAPRVELPVTWSGPALTAPVQTTVTIGQPVRVNYRLTGTDGSSYPRTMVSTPNVRLNLRVGEEGQDPERAAQTIRFRALPPVVYAPGRVVRMTASASSGLPVTLESSAPAVAEVSGRNVVIRGAGTAVITAAQAGDAAWQPATRTRELVVAPARQVITFRTKARRPFVAGGRFQLTARAGSRLPVTLVSSDEQVLTIEGTTAVMVAPGRVAIRALQAGDTNYQAARPVTRTVTLE